MAELWNVTNEQYHADSTKIGSSMLKLAIKSPSEYKRRFIDDPPLVDPPSPALTMGSLVHALTLEPDQFSKLFAVRPNVDGRTTVGKEALAKFRLTSLGKTEVTVEQHEQAKAIANAALAEPVVHDFVERAVKEQAIIWEEDGLTFKVKPDMFIALPEMDVDLLLDLKTADDPTPECFGSGSSFSPIRKYNYSLQAAHYCTGMAAYTGRPCMFGLVVVGKQDPWEVFLYDISPWIELGMHQRRAAIQAILNGQETNWRRPEQGNVTILSPSKWDYSNE